MLVGSFRASYRPSIPAVRPTGDKDLPVTSPACNAGTVFWDQLTEREQEAMIAIGARRTFSSGDYVLHEGEASTHVLVLLSGRLKLVSSSPEGRTVIIEFRERGELVGEMGVVDDSPRSVGAVASTEVEALIVPADRFRQLLMEGGGIVIAVLSSMAERLRQTSVRRLEQGTADTVTRVAGRLVELSEGKVPDAKGQIVLSSALTQQELADWIGASRDAVVLALGQLRDLRWIETGRQQFRILDLDALRRFTNEL